MHQRLTWMNWLDREAAEDLIGDTTAKIEQRPAAELVAVSVHLLKENRGLKRHIAAASQASETKRR